MYQHNTLEAVGAARQGIVLSVPLRVLFSCGPKTENRLVPLGGQKNIVVVFRLAATESDVENLGAKHLFRGDGSSRSFIAGVNGYFRYPDIGNHKVIALRLDSTRAEGLTSTIARVVGKETTVCAVPVDTDPSTIDHIECEGSSNRGDPGPG